MKQKLLDDVVDIAMTIAFFALVMVFVVMSFAGKPVPQSDKDRKYLDSLKTIVKKQKNEHINQRSVNHHRH